MSEGPKLTKRGMLEEHEAPKTGQFNVCQFFMDGTYEYVRRFVREEEAVPAAMHYATSVGAQVGTTVRVIITDGGDCCAWEWKREEGVVFPPGFGGWLKGGDSNARPPGR